MNGWDLVVLSDEVSRLMFPLLCGVYFTQS